MTNKTNISQTQTDVTEMLCTSLSVEQLAGFGTGTSDN